MTGPAVVSIARIAPDLARRYWDRVRRVLAAGTPERLRPHVAVQAAPSSEPDADAAATLYVNWAFKPDTPDEVVEDIYIPHAAARGRGGGSEREPAGDVAARRRDRRPHHDRRSTAAGRRAVKGRRRASVTATADATDGRRTPQPTCVN